MTPFVNLARTIRRHFDGILAYFEAGYTTSVSEGLNTKPRLATTPRLEPPELPAHRIGCDTPARQ